MSTPLAKLETRREDDRLVLHVTGEIDLSNAADVYQEIEEAVAGASEVVVDLRELDYMDSQGVRLLHRLASALDAAGVELVVLAPSDTIAGEVLRLTGMTELVPVRQRLDE